MRRPLVDLRRALKLLMQHARRNIIANNVPRRIRPFLVIEGMLTTSDLAPPRNAAGRVNLDEDDLALVGAAKACFEEMDQGHPDQPERDAIYSEGHGDSKYSRLSRSNRVTARPRPKQSRNALRTLVCDSIV